MANRRSNPARGLSTIAQSIGRTRSQRNVGFQRGRPPTVGQGAYTQPITTMITAGYAAKTVPASGIVTLYVGPQGVGMTWYPQAVAIATTTGANDASTCALYLSPLQNGTNLATTTQIGGQSYAGGGDTIGLAVPPLEPGLFIIAQWTGATAGDLASLQVYGTQRTLT